MNLRDGRDTSVISDTDIRRLEYRIIHWLLDWGWMAIGLVTLLLLYIGLITWYEPFADGAL